MIVAALTGCVISNIHNLMTAFAQALFIMSVELPTARAFRSCCGRNDEFVIIYRKLAQCFGRFTALDAGDDEPVFRFCFRQRFDLF